MLLTYGDSPLADTTSADFHKKILHAVLVLGDCRLTGSDAPLDQYRRLQGFSVTLSIADTHQAELIFDSLAEGGSVEMPLQQTFWAHRFGVLVDQFGTPWEINCGRGPNPS